MINLHISAVAQRCEEVFIFTIVSSVCSIGFLPYTLIGPVKALGLHVSAVTTGAGRRKSCLINA